MLRESLDNLERKILTARSASAEEARIRTTEAELLLKFIGRARDVRPKGQVVLSFWKGNREVYLEDGDTLHIPSKSNLVLVHGEVLYPNAQLHEENSIRRISLIALVVSPRMPISLPSYFSVRMVQSTTPKPLVLPSGALARYNLETRL